MKDAVHLPRSTSDPGRGTVVDLGSRSGSSASGSAALHKSGSFSSCVSALRAAVDLGVGTAGLQYSREQGAPRPGVGSPPPLESRLVNAGARSPKIGGGQPRRRFNDGVSAEPRRVVSFSKESAHSDGSVQLANDSVTPVAGRYISQYDIKARRRRQTESVQAHTGGDAGATDERWASGSLAGSWLTRDRGLCVRLQRYQEVFS